MLCVVGSASRASSIFSLANCCVLYIMSEGVLRFWGVAGNYFRLSNECGYQASSSPTQPLQHVAETRIFMQPFALRSILCSQRIFDMLIRDSSDFLNQEKCQQMFACGRGKSHCSDKMAGWAMVHKASIGQAVDLHGKVRYATRSDAKFPGPKDSL